jgi:hypothetical protein
MEKYRVFISSEMDELKEERHVAQSAIEELSRSPYNLHFEPVMFEHFGARTQSVKEVYKEKVRMCNIYLGIIGKKYGTIIDESGLSGTHEEYRTAYKAHNKMLIYVLDIDERKDVREERVKEFIEEVEERHTYQKFENKDQLKDFIKRDLFEEYDYLPDVSESEMQESKLTEIEVKVREVSVSTTLPPLPNDAKPSKTEGKRLLEEVADRIERRRRGEKLP